MKTSIIKTLTLTLTLTLLGVSAPQVFAESKVVINEAVTEADKTYDSGGADIALMVLSEGAYASYSGTNITLNATDSETIGAFVYSTSTLSLTDSNINISPGAAGGVAGQSRANIIFDHVNITGAGGGVVLFDSATATLTNININTTFSDEMGLLGIVQDSKATVNLNGNTLLTNGPDGIWVEYGSILTLTGSNGSVITSDVRAISNSVVEITLSGAGTQLIGDVSIDTTSAFALTLGAGALLNGAGSVTDLTLAAGAILGYTDVLTVTDTITIGEGITIDFSNLTLEDDAPYTILDFTTASGDVTLGNISYSGLGENQQGAFSLADRNLYFTATAVPEPSTWFLLGAGLGALALIRRRQS
ncbi:MAG: PEP-CTERM sorting domain-containing protein [Verrucomicrobiales bacterium]|jgi:hypothetical protein|nr:PEP-CTERM sorting domain-containing protein [Verrucomicrobiales bacterium]